ncbi:MAG: beta-lactamase family protein [Polyangiaceae bacterium]|nr:beta-lactamase family protein [Polyangiaceae bacterium]
MTDFAARRSAVSSPPPPFENEVDLTAVARVAVVEIEASPCAVVATAVRKNGRFRWGAGAFGRLSFSPVASAVSTHSPFDLASVTKPFTALSLARLEKKGMLSRKERLGEVVPELADTFAGRLPLDLLASHRAGLDGHRPLYAPLVTGERVDRAKALEIAASARRVEVVGDVPDEGYPAVYSDLGYLLLGEAIARRAGRLIDEVVLEEVVGPLGLWVGSARQLSASQSDFDDKVAPTEEVEWRGGVIRGCVHDENAWAMAGRGSCGHAGLFGDARSVVLLGAAILEALKGERPDWLAAEDLEPVLRPRPNGSHLAGFDSRTGETPSSGPKFGPKTFGHLGFTGTSLWIDPEAERVGVLLTNRVHPTRAKDAIRRARPAVYERLVDAMEGQ